ncbi:MAG: 4a-hydroxytetrahydrobiopterin dehydratase, partial [Mycobacteriales bacterium]
SGERLSRGAASAAIGPGWRYVLGAACTAVPVASLARAAEVGVHAVGAAGADADEHLRVDLRPGRALLAVQSFELGVVTARDVEVVARVTAAVGGMGLRLEPGAVAGARAVQTLEIAIDALDIPAIRPFWKALFGYGDEGGSAGVADALVDPAGQGPSIWFQQMDEPRPQRNRIHFDMSVAHDEAPGRLAAALAAGGRLLSDAEAPAFWVLADAEGNEACVTTWQGRD